MSCTRFKESLAAGHNEHAITDLTSGILITLNVDKVPPPPARKGQVNSGPDNRQIISLNVYLRFFGQFDPLEDLVEAPPDAQGPVRVHEGVAILGQRLVQQWKFLIDPEIVYHEHVVILDQV